MKTSAIVWVTFGVLTTMLLLSSCTQEEEVTPKPVKSEGLTTSENITCALVSTPRVITIGGENLPSSVSSALNMVISQYNNAGASLLFVRKDASPDITIKMQPGAFGFTSGFPTSSGNPYPLITLKFRHG